MAPIPRVRMPRTAASKFVRDRSRLTRSVAFAIRVQERIGAGEITMVVTMVTDIGILECLATGKFLAAGM